MVLKLEMHLLGCIISFDHIIVQSLLQLSFHSHKLVICTCEPSYQVNHSIQYFLQYRKYIYMYIPLKIEIDFMTNWKYEFLFYP